MATGAVNYEHALFEASQNAAMATINGQLVFAQIAQGAVQIQQEAANSWQGPVPGGMSVKPSNVGIFFSHLTASQAEKMVKSELQAFYSKLKWASKSTGGCWTAHWRSMNKSSMSKIEEIGKALGLSGTWGYNSKQRSITLTNTWGSLHLLSPPNLKAQGDGAAVQYQASKWQDGSLAWKSFKVGALTSSCVKAVGAELIADGCVSKFGSAKVSNISMTVKQFANYVAYEQSHGASASKMNVLQAQFTELRTQQSAAANTANSNVQTDSATVQQLASNLAGLANVNQSNTQNAMNLVGEERISTS